MLVIDDKLSIPEREIVFSAIRARGPGGQNVNKVASAVELRFDIAASAALPEDVKLRLIALRDRRISADGVVVIKAQRSRSQEKNRADARRRLKHLVEAAIAPVPVRKKTRPGRRERERRLEDKAHRAKIKRARRKVSDD